MTLGNVGRESMVVVVRLERVDKYGLCGEVSSYQSGCWIVDAWDSHIFPWLVLCNLQLSS